MQPDQRDAAYLWDMLDAAQPEPQQIFRRSYLAFRISSRIEYPAALILFNYYSKALQPPKPEIS